MAIRHTNRLTMNMRAHTHIHRRARASTRASNSTSGVSPSVNVRALILSVLSLASLKPVELSSVRKQDIFHMVI